jgi:hypothetical protein
MTAAKLPNEMSRYDLRLLHETALDIVQIQRNMSVSGNVLCSLTPLSSALMAMKSVI